jgi:hypothetical protein
MWTPPSRRRRRWLTVCAGQLRKGKCDRGQPACGWCAANSKVCEYKERKKPGLRAGYGRDLEKRLSNVEELLGSHSQLLETLSRVFGSNAAKATQVRSPTQFVQTPPYHGSTPEGAVPSAIAYAGNAQDPIQGAKSGHHTSESFGGMPGNGQLVAYQDLPPYDLLYALVDLYFTHVNTWCPMLDRRTTLNSLFGASAVGESQRILLHAIVAMSLRFSKDPRLNNVTRNIYHDSSKKTVMLFGLENPSIASLQALVILALDFVGSSNGGAGLNLLALIARSAVQLGLTVEASSSLNPMLLDYPSISTLRAKILPDPQDWIEDEGRRRLFWCIYMLDRDATVATAFGFALDEKDIDRKLPCRDDLYARNQPVETRYFQTAKRTDYSINFPEHMGAFSYIIEVKGFLSRIHQFLKSPVDISALSDVEIWQRTYR